MATRSGQNKKQSTLPPTVTPLSLRPTTWYALTPQHPELTGTVFTGRDLPEAETNARAYLARWGKARNYDIQLTIEEDTE